MLKALIRILLYNLIILLKIKYFYYFKLNFELNLHIDYLIVL